MDSGVAVHLGDLHFDPSADFTSQRGFKDFCFGEKNRDDFGELGWVGFGWLVIF